MRCCELGPEHWVYYSSFRGWCELLMVGQLCFTFTSTWQRCLIVGVLSCRITHSFYYAKQLRFCIFFPFFPYGFSDYLEREVERKRMRLNFFNHCEVQGIELREAFVGYSRSTWRTPEERRIGFSGIVFSIRSCVRRERVTY